MHSSHFFSKQFKTVPNLFFYFILFLWIPVNNLRLILWLLLRIQPLLPYIKCPQEIITGKSNSVQTDIKSPLSVTCRPCNCCTSSTPCVSSECWPMKSHQKMKRCTLQLLTGTTLKFMGVLHNLSLFLFGCSNYVLYWKDAAYRC